MVPDYRELSVQGEGHRGLWNRQEPDLEEPDLEEPDLEEPDAAAVDEPIPDPSRPHLGVEMYGDGASLLPSQFFGQSKTELEAEQKLQYVMLATATDDWRSLFEVGHLANEHIRDSRLADRRADALTLRDYLFDDSYGAGDPVFITIRTACLALGIDLNQLRAALRTIGDPARLRELPLFADAAPRPKRSRLKEPLAAAA